MSIIFKPENHEYSSIENDGINWISATSFIGNFKQPFEADKQAEKSRKNKKSKWYGLTKEEVLQAWSNEALRATTLGTWYHNEREADICGLDTLQKNGTNIPIFRPIENEGIKYAPDQKLVDGVYPEHMIYLKSSGLCGQSDLVEVVDGKVHITDYKTNKEIKDRGFSSWDGTVTKMQRPINHLDDCNLNHYNLQLSLYMYMILKHNPRLKAGELIIHHILFDEVGRDKYDNPITARHTNGDPIVKDVIIYKLPYLKSEIMSLLDYLKSNREQIKGKK